MIIEASEVTATSIVHIMDTLLYSSYKANRDLGMTHEAAVRIGIGKPEFKVKYESESN